MTMTDEDIKRLRDALEDVGSLRGIPSPRPFSKYDKGAYEMIHGVAPKLREAVAAIDTLTRERDEARSVAGACEESMRALACYLGVGGYNTDTFDANVFHQKIRDGIDMATVPIRQFIERASKAEARAERAEKVVGAARNAAVYADAPKTHEMDDGEAGVVCAWDVLDDLRAALTAYDAITAPAEPADTPQSDIVGDGASEGGSAHQRASERLLPVEEVSRALEWNIMGDK